MPVEQTGAGSQPPAEHHQLVLEKPSHFANREGVIFRAFRNIPYGAEGFRIFRNCSESFRTLRNASEGFRSLQNCSEVRGR